ncbi:MAG: hypothetical protein PVF83_13610 [Anaerolineales bacterium]|jgi:hypothetical protein
MEWIQDCWWWAFDEETAEDVFLLVVYLRGMAASPASHCRRRNPPRTLGIKGIRALFNPLVYKEVIGPSGRKDGGRHEW